MTRPTVSFVVPCYKLAHLLPDCITSILSQSYQDFEVLIMDDSSPDNTAAVSHSFHDGRIRHIRNDQNLGPLPNYNKGIGLSRGKYVWLISADDYLRRPYVLEHYVDLMDRHPNIAYTFCPGISVRDGQEVGIWHGSEYATQDHVLGGRQFFKTLRWYNMVLAPSAMARRTCYENVSLFPVDMTWAGKHVDFVWGGDWYLWCVFALYGDVGYFAEPMVCYREHELSMTNAVTQHGSIEDCAAAEIAVLWMVKQKAREAGLHRASEDCLEAIANQYARHCTSKRYHWLDRTSESCMSIGAFEDSLCRSTESEKERNWLRARVFSEVGDNYCFQGDRRSARSFYMAGLQKDPLMAKVYAKLVLLSCGRPGEYVRRRLQA